MKRNLFLFIGRFFGSYLILFLLYQWFLNAQLTYKVDEITVLVADWSCGLLNLYYKQVNMMYHPSEASLKILVNGVYLVRIIEGCNGISVIILFCAFVISFYNKFMITFAYLFFGSISIFIINILRITILTFCLERFPNYGDFLHSVVFPGIIYSYIVVLWFIWIQYFSKYKSNA